MRRVIAFVIVLFSAALAEAATAPSAQVAVALELQADTSLPGIPVGFRVTLTNTSSAPLTVPAKAALLVRDDQGQSFLANCDVMRTILVVEEWAGQKIAPHQSSSYTLSTRGLMSHPLWFADSRLSKSGRFELQMMVGDGLREDMNIEDTRQRDAVSNTVTLTIQEPRGVDADVWRLMLALGGGTWGPGHLYVRSGQEFARRVVTEFPSSSYTPWFAAMGAAPTTEEREAILRDWLSRAPEEPNTNWRRFRLLEWQIALADRYFDTKPQLSRGYEAKARANLNTILKQPNDEELNKRAKERLDYLDDPVEP